MSDQLVGPRPVRPPVLVPSTSVTSSEGGHTVPMPLSAGASPIDAPQRRLGGVVVGSAGHHTRAGVSASAAADPGGASSPLLAHSHTASGPTSLVSPSRPGGGGASAPVLIGASASSPVPSSRAVAAAGASSSSASPAARRVGINAPPPAPSSSGSHATEHSHLLAISPAAAYADEHDHTTELNYTDVHHRAHEFHVLEKTASRVMHTNGYCSLYTVQALLALALLLWGLVHKMCLSRDACMDYTSGEGVTFALLLAIADAFFAAEVVVRCIGTRCQFCQSCFNVFDLLCALAATAGIPMVFRREWSSTLTVLVPFVLFARHFVQSLRMCIILQRNRERIDALHVASQYPVDFTAADAADAAAVAQPNALLLGASPPQPAFPTGRGTGTPQSAHRAFAALPPPQPHGHHHHRGVSTGSSGTAAPPPRSASAAPDS